MRQEFEAKFLIAFTLFFDDKYEVAYSTSVTGHSKLDDRSHIKLSSHIFSNKVSR